MWTCLGFVAFCSLMSPVKGIPKESSPGILLVISPTTVSKYTASIILRHHLLQSHILAIQFPPGPPSTEKAPEHWIRRLHMVKVGLPIVSVELKANATAQLHIRARLHLSAQYHFGHLFERFDFIVDVHVLVDMKLQEYSVGIFRLGFEKCETEITITKIICPSYLVKTKVKPLVVKILTATLPGALCKVAQRVSDVAVLDFLHTTNVLLTIRPTLTLQYKLAHLPGITPVALETKLNIIIRNAEQFLTVPVSAHPTVFPSLKGHSLCVLLTQDALNAILPVVIRVRPREFITTPQVFSDSLQLINAVALLISHQKCPTCPEKSPLKISLTVVEAAVIILHPKGAHIRLALEIAVAAKDPLGAIIDLFVLKANLKLNVEIFVHDSRLTFLTKLHKADLLLISSDIGHFSVTSLVKLIHLLLVETFMPLINDCLNAGIPIPSVMGIKLDYPTFKISQGSLELCV